MVGSLFLVGYHAEEDKGLAEGSVLEAVPLVWRDVGKGIRFNSLVPVLAEDLALACQYIDLVLVGVVVEAHFSSRGDDEAPHGEVLGSNVLVNEPLDLHALHEVHLHQLLGDFFLFLDNCHDVHPFRILTF